MEYELKLYISGNSGNSRKAMNNLKDITHALTEETCNVEVIDIAEIPQKAIEDRIIATPVLTKVSPLPIRRVIGDLSDKDNVIFMLGLK